MQRVQKQGGEPENVQCTVQAKFTSKSREAERESAIDNSPAMIAQRKKLNSLFGGAIQRVEDEEPLQGKFETAQRVEEEEPLQGKFEAVQRVEEEEPLQGKFETAQRVEEDEPLQGKFETVQRVDEEEPLQGKFEAMQRVEEEEPLQGKFEAASSIQLKEEVAKPNNTGLPDNLKSGIENLSGMSMDNVKVHYNSSQPAQLNALAYAQGMDIHVAPGQEQHLPHEAWHVVQQAQGRVKPTMQMKEGVPVNDDAGLEHEADVMGVKAVQMQEAAQAANSVVTSDVVQRAAHRAEQGSQIMYQGQVWDVTVSAILNPNITIRRNNHTQHLTWRTADYTIIRQNNNQDHDLRENDPGALNGPVDAYAGLSSFDRQAKIRTKFRDARLQALAMIKATATNNVNQQSIPSLNTLTLDDFSVVRKGPTLEGAGKNEEAAEWHCMWTEGDQQNPRRVWTFVIDADNPLSTSSQEPHVGWTVSAAPGTQAAVGNTFGHVWVDFVPVMR